jgi:hypothetical protein
MAAWTKDELTTIGNAEEVEISSLRRDGTPRKSRTIWVVRVDDSLYVRSVRGRDSDWFRGTRTRREGSIEAGGTRKDVTFEDVGGAPGDRIDAAYREKYRRYAGRILDSTLTPEAKSTTLKLTPRS